jgi:3,4-dihydroxy-2-butanone 4-phosphate synthase
MRTICETRDKREGEGDLIAVAEQQSVEGVSAQ